MEHTLAKEANSTPAETQSLIMVQILQSLQPWLQSTMAPTIVFVLYEEGIICETSIY